MFLRPESSLIPAVTTLSSFFISNFPHIFWYPGWYLGNPFAYLIGPFVPFVLLLTSKFLPLSLSIQYFYLILLSQLIGGIGIYFFVKEWGTWGNIKRYSAFLSALLYVCLPFAALGLYFQNGLKNIAVAFLPFIFIIIKRILISGMDKASQFSAPRFSGAFGVFLLILLTTSALLTTVNILLSIVIGFLASFFAVNSLIRQNPKIKPHIRLEEKSVRIILILLLSLSLSTLWYTPKFWLVLLTNPSFGGLPLWNLVVKIFQYLLNFLPLILAILVVKWRFLGQRIKAAQLFSLLFFISFFFLTAARFLADPKFVIDWIGFIPESQFGISLLAGLLAGWLLDYFKNSKIPSVKIYHGIISGLLTLLILVFFSITGFLMNRLFFYSLSKYQTDIITSLQKHIKDRGERIFLSGSDVFWLNAQLDISQIRGSNDPSSVNPFWSHGSYQIREGESQELTRNWLRIFGSPYILVHQLESQDPFHDFKQTQKFKNFHLLEDRNGDQLYHIPKTWLARTADKNLLAQPRPSGGADVKALSGYTRYLSSPVSYQFANPQTLTLTASPKKDQIISIAMSYDSDWRIISGKGQLLADPLGNIVIMPGHIGPQALTLQYQKSISGLLLPLFVSLIIVILLLKFDFLYPLIRKRLPKIHLGLGSEDEEY